MLQKFCVAGQQKPVKPDSLSFVISVETQKLNDILKASVVLGSSQAAVPFHSTLFVVVDCTCCVSKYLIH